MLTAQEICDAALIEFKKAPRNGSREGDRRRQLHADVALSPEDLEMGLGELLERILKPAMSNLANAVPEDVIFLDLINPLQDDEGVKFAKSEYLRFAWGTLRDLVTAFNETTGEPTEYGDRSVMRFDILFDLA